MGGALCPDLAAVESLAALRAHTCSVFWADYLRSKAAADAIKFTVDQQSLQRKSLADAKNVEGMSQLSTSIENNGECLSCGA